MSYYPQYAPPPQVLPPGWQVAYTNEGQMYYVDHNNQSTHWQLPAYATQNMYGGGRGMDYGRGRGGRPGRVGIDHTKRKTKMCMNYESGTCSWGDRCAFAHGAHELLPQGHPGAQGQQGQQGQPQQMYDQQMYQQQMQGYPMQGQPQPGQPQPGQPQQQPQVQQQQQPTQQAPQGQAPQPHSPMPAGEQSPPAPQAPQAPPAQ